MIDKLLSNIYTILIVLFVFIVLAGSTLFYIVTTRINTATDVITSRIDFYYAVDSLQETHIKDSLYLLNRIDSKWDIYNTDELLKDFQIKLIAPGVIKVYHKTDYIGTFDLDIRTMSDIMGAYNDKVDHHYHFK